MDNLPRYESDPKNLDYNQSDIIIDLHVLQSSVLSLDHEKSDNVAEIIEVHAKKIEGFINNYWRDEEA